MGRITLLVITSLIYLQLHLQHQFPFILSAYYLALTLITFIIYALDKSAARKGHWRVKELYLHLLSLAGGWWGALLAQQLIRHKSIKKAFLITFNATMLINILLLTLVLHKGLI